MKSKIAYIVIDDDKICVSPYKDGDGYFHRYWVKDAGIKDEWQYPCVMVKILFEIRELQELGFAIRIVDRTTHRVDVPACSRHLSDDEIIQKYGI